MRGYVCVLMIISVYVRVCDCVGMILCVHRGRSMRACDCMRRGMKSLTKKRWRKKNRLTYFTEHIDRNTVRYSQWLVDMIRLVCCSLCGLELRKRDLGRDSEIENGKKRQKLRERDRERQWVGKRGEERERGGEWGREHGTSNITPWNSSSCYQGDWGRLEKNMNSNALVVSILNYPLHCHSFSPLISSMVHLNLLYSTLLHLISLAVPLVVHLFSFRFDSFLFFSLLSFSFHFSFLFYSTLFYRIRFYSMLFCSLSFFSFLYFLLFSILHFFSIILFPSLLYLSSPLLSFLS